MLFRDFIWLVLLQELNPFGELAAGRSLLKLLQWTAKFPGETEPDQPLA
jgi:hypothetical protein